MEVETHEKEPTRKYRQNTQKSVRDARIKKKAKGEKSKSTDTRYLKKAFMKSVEKANYQVSRIHQFIGNSADFFIWSTLENCRKKKENFWSPDT